MRALVNLALKYVKVRMKYQLAFILFAIILTLKVQGQSVQDYYQAGYQSLLNGDYYQAKEHMNKVLSLNPENMNALYYRGIARGFIGDHEGAFNDFNKVLKMDPNNKNAQFNRGASKVLMGKIRQGCKYLQRLAKFGDKEAEDFVKRQCN